MIHKRLYALDKSDRKSILAYEDLLRHRLVKFGYRLSKSKTIEPDRHISLKVTPIKRGFRITDINSSTVVAGEKYDFPLEEVEKFWEAKYVDWQEAKRRERLERMAAKARPKTIQLDGKWTVTNDNRAIRALRDHVEQYGDFDADGHGSSGDIAEMMYRMYRPYACPKFAKVWPVDGDWSNLTDYNLVSDADDKDLPENVVQITTQRRIWHDEHRIFIKLPIHDDLFFTTFSPKLFQILCSEKELESWYIQKQIRNTKVVHRLYCRVRGKSTSFAEVVALYDDGRIVLDDIAGSILAGKSWLRENNLQVDHLRNNTKNNCQHSIAIMLKSENASKRDIFTRISAPFAFIVVRVEKSFRILLGKFGTPDEYACYIICNGVKQFLECLDAFYKVAKASGEMLPVPEDHSKTNRISQMLQDDGLEYHDGKYNPVEGLLRADNSEFTPWSGDLQCIIDETPITNGD